MTSYDSALIYYEAGLSIIPVRPDGTKAPGISSWKAYQRDRASLEQVERWYRCSPSPGIAIICGEVSGNLEVMDFDVVALYDTFATHCRDVGLEDILVTLPLVQTPEGMHLYYRLRPDTKVPGNTELAAWMVNAGDGTLKQETSIETRGEGGYVVAPGSPAACHPKNDTYRLTRGDLTAIPVISNGTWEAFRAIARSLTQTQLKDDLAPIGGAAGTAKGDVSVNRPGDAYGLTREYEGVLERHGWRRVSHRGEIALWRRPGKEKGISATSNWAGSNLFYVFSTNAAPFESKKSYTPLAVYAILEHGGDYSAAAKALGAKGYGAPPSSQGVRMKKPNGKSVEQDDEGSAGEDLDLAMRWAAQYKQEFAYVEGDQWWRCKDGKIWRYSSFEMATASMQHFLMELKLAGGPIKVNRNKVSGVLFLAKSEVGPRSANSFDHKPGWIPLANGVYDLEKGELLPHAPTNWITRYSPFDYDPEARCPRWKQFLSEVLIETNGKRCQEWIDALQLWFGYCLIPDASHQTSMIWVGEGRNGKGVATRVLTKLVGPKSVASIPIEQLHDPYHRADLQGKLVGLVNEPDPKAMQKNGNWFKAIVGGDEISARRPTEKVFSFTPTCRLIISCNEMPKTRDLSKGYFQRIIPIEWRYNVPPEKRDRTLDAQLEAELPGIFNWALEGLRRLQSDPELRIAPEASNRLLEDYQVVEDAIGRFLLETYERGNSNDDRISNDEIYQAYKNWCLANGEFQHRALAISSRLSKMGFKSLPYKVTALDGTTKSQRCWLPLKKIGSNDDDPYQE